MYLSIGIICQPGDDFINNVKDSVISITNQINKQTVDLMSYVVLIGIESENPLEIGNIKTKFKSLPELSIIDINFITVDSDLLEQRLNYADVEPAYYIHHKSFIRRITLQNILVSSLTWFSSQQSKYFLFTDSKLRLKKGALQELKNRIVRFEKKPLLFEVKVVPIDMIGSLYNSRFLPRLAESLFWSSPYVNLVNLFMNFMHVMPIIQRDKSKDTYSIFDIQKNSLAQPKHMKNPLALISTNMKVYDEIHFPTNPYERGELFWSPTNWLTNKKNPKIFQNLTFEVIHVL